MRRLAVLVVIAACGGGRAPASPPPGLHVAARYPVYAHAVGWDGDGRHWYADDGRTLRRFVGPFQDAHWPLGIGPQHRILPLGSRGVIAGGYVPDDDGVDRGGIEAWSHGYARFAGVEEVSAAPDGESVLVAVHDYPSACDCDREVRNRGPMVALARPGGAITTLFVDGAVVALAAGPELAVAAGQTVRLWPRDGRGAPRELALAGYPSVQHLFWAGDQLVVVGIREVRVLDRTGAERARWPFDDALVDAALSTDGTLALVTTGIASGYTVTLHALDGAVIGRLPLDAAWQIAWSPDGAALLVSASTEVLELRY